MNHLADIMMAAVVFTAIYGVVQLFVKRKERIMLIEKGATPPPEMKSDFLTFSSLKFGTFFIGIGLGILIANILTVSTALDQEVAYFSMVFLFGGLALVIHHLMEKKNKA
ncbi:MAG: hypothetical protein HC905_03975 [Bacteroidales bacterium]|nr:hypothetical protein [Bacteroidales bacterium]